MARSLKEILAEHEAKKNAKPAEVPQPAQTNTAAPARKGFLSRVSAKPSEPTHVHEVRPNGAEHSASVPAPSTPAPQATTVAVELAPPPRTDLKDADISSLRRNLDYLAEHIEHKELVGQVVRNIAAQLQENPQFSSQMQPHDFNLIVRGLRKAFNTAARKKSEGVAKKKASDDETNEILEMLKGAGIGLG